GLIIGSLAAGGIAATIVQPQGNMTEHIRGLGKFLFWVLLATVVVTIRAFEMEGGSTLSWVLKTALAVPVMFGLGEVLRAWLATLWADTGLSFLTLWLTYTSLGVLAFNLAGLSGDPRAFLATFAGGVALLYIWNVISRCELTLLSRWLTDETLVRGEAIRTSAEIRGNVGVGPHDLGVLHAWSLMERMQSKFWIA